jgi:hypothetical protein
LQAELVHHHLTREINRQAVDPVLEANWGPAYRGKVRLEAAPLSDANQGFLRQLVTQVLSDPKNFADLFRRADWPSIFDAVGLPQTKASSAATSGPPAMLSAIRQLQREALEGADGSSTAGRPRNDVATQPPDVHTEAGAADALRLAGFDPSQRRDKHGRWSKDGSSVGPSAATALMDVVDPIEGPLNKELQKTKDKAQQQLKDHLEELKKAIKEASEGPKTAFKRDFKWTLKPTNRQNANILRRNMGAKLAPGEEPHHIVQALDQNSWAQRSRSLIRYYQVDINSGENGASLARASHQGQWLQKNFSKRLVYDRLRQAAGTGRPPRPGSEAWEAARQEVVSELSRLEEEIEAGTFPPGNPRSLP